MMPIWYVSLMTDIHSMICCLEESLLGKKVCIMRHDDRNETVVEDGFSFEQRIVDKLQKEDLQ